MASARPGPPDRLPGLAGKGGFAKRVRGFAKRVAALPGFPYMWIACATAAGFMTVTGGFGTIGMPLGQRTGFWAALMAWALVKWQLWFLFTVREPRHWLRAALGGMVVLSLPLPFEVTLAAWLVGVPSAPDFFGTWTHALAISVVLLTAIALVMRVQGHRLFGSAPTPDVANGLLVRARVAPDSLAAIEAEDHYCRVRRRDGASALIHYRFGDALEEMAEIEGAQVHRGAWVAADAVTGAAREGRRWHLLLADGSKVAVSATYLAEVRSRGWLAR